MSITTTHPTSTVERSTPQAIKGGRAKRMIGGLVMAVLSVVYLVPVIGWMIREFVEGPLEAKAWFVLCCVLTAIILVATYGYPALITIALGGVVMGFGVVLATTLE